MGGVGVKAWAVFADVGVGQDPCAGARRQYPPARRDLITGVSFHPVPVMSVIGSPTAVFGSAPIWLFARSRARSYSVRTVWSKRWA